MGHPFTQGYIKENTVQTDLLACDISGQVEEHFGLGASGLNSVTTVGAPVNKSEGKTNDVLQTIYEQLLRINSEEMQQGPDQSGNSSGDAAVGILRQLIFKTGNVVTFYIRPRLLFELDVGVGSTAFTSAVGNALGISGDTINNAQVAAQDIFNKIFSTNDSATDPLGYKWLAGRGESGVGLNQWQTNLSKTGNVLAELNAREALDGTTTTVVGMLDAHIWKIEVTL